MPILQGMHEGTSSLGVEPETTGSCPYQPHQATASGRLDRRPTEGRAVLATLRRRTVKGRCDGRHSPRRSTSLPQAHRCLRTRAFAPRPRVVVFEPDASCPTAARLPSPSLVRGIPTAWVSFRTPVSRIAREHPPVGPAPTCPRYTRSRPHAEMLRGKTQFLLKIDPAASGGESGKGRAR